MNGKIPGVIRFRDLRAQYHSIQSEIDSAVVKLLASGDFILGSEVAAFEEEFAAYCGARHAIAVNSGTSALHLALLAAGVGPGDEVITTPFTFIATSATILYTGARPVFADIDPETFTLDPARAEAAITPRTKAIVPVHLYGHPADMDPILDIARRHRLTVVEDAAQAHGAEYKGRRAGVLGDIACFSFYPTKNLGACGEGGAVVTNSTGHASLVRKLRNWAQEGAYRHAMHAFNYRMEGIQGAVLRVKLRHLERWTGIRRARAALYDKLLCRPPARADVRHVYHVYAIRSKQRDELKSFLERHGIETKVYYPIPLHLQEACASLGYRQDDFPVAEQAAREQLSLPIYPELTESEARSVVESIQAFGSAPDTRKAAGMPL